MCLEIFDNVRRREDHSCAKIESDGSRFTCHLHEPSMVFDKQAALEAHLREAHGDDGTAMAELKKTCPVCQKVRERDDQYCISNSALMFQSFFQKFLLKKNLMTHMQRFHEEETSDHTSTTAEASPQSSSKRHACKFCSKTFLYDADKQEHENTHTGEKKHKCDSCDKSYSSGKALQFHKKNIHSDEVHKCDVCGKQLSNKYKLKSHMKVHSDKRSFKCPTCGTTFKSKENLTRHLRNVHKFKEEKARDESIVLNQS